MKVGHVRIGRVNTEPKEGYIAIEADRDTLLGNPYKLAKEEERNMCCEAYQDWYYSDEPDQKLRTRVNSLIRMLIHGCNLELQCHCVPKRCHTEVIKADIEKRAAKYVEDQQA